jgi:hypothetical protein
MGKVSRVAQYGAPVAAPLLQLPGAGPRYDVPGAAKPEFGKAAKTVAPQKIKDKTPEKAGAGPKVDVTI